MAKIDILCKFQSLDSIIEKYGTAIDRLTIAFYDLEAVCDEMEEGQYWLGDAHEAYVKLYAEWRDAFLRKLAGLIVFQSALNCVQESLQSVFNARNDLSNDISVSGATSPISADSDSAKVLRVHYAQATSAEYEIESSNPRFLDEIINLLSDAKLEVDCISSSDYPNIKDIRSSMTNFCNDLKSERQRYTGFAGSYYSFCNGIQAMEGMLNSTIDSMFAEHLAGMNPAQIESMVKDYANGSFSYDLSNLGISQTDAIFLIELNILLNTKDVTADEMRALCDEYEKLGANKALIDSIVEEGLEELISNSAEDVLVDAIAVYLGKTTALSARDLTDKSILIASQISLLSAKADVIIGKMGKKANYYPESGYYKTRLRTLQEAIDSLSDEKRLVDKELNATIKLDKWGNVLSWTLIGVDVAVEGFRSRGIDGLDWDDVCQNMADEALAGIAGLTIGSMATTLISTTSAGSYAGPLGTGIGLAAGVILSAAKPAHELFELSTDWWDMLCW